MSELNVSSFVILLISLVHLQDNFGLLHLVFLGIVIISIGSSILTKLLAEILNTSSQMIRQVSSRKS